MHRGFRATVEGRSVWSLWLGDVQLEGCICGDLRDICSRMLMEYVPCVFKVRNEDNENRGGTSTTHGL